MLGRSACWAAIVAGALSLSACARLPSEGVITIERTSLLLDPSAAPPAASAPGWEPRPLPDFWGVARRRVATSGWYRADFDLAARPGELWAVYLPRVGLNVAVYVNGELVGDGGRFSEPLARNWNRPLFFPVPAGLLRAGANTLLVRHVTTVQSPALVRPFLLGPHRLLLAPYERRYLAQVTVPQVVAAVLLVIGILSFLLYLRHDHDGSYRWFAAGVLLWAWSTANAFVRDVPMSNALWEWLQGTVIGWFVLCFVLAFHRQLGLVRPRLERALATAGVAGSVGLAVAPPLYFMNVLAVWVAGAIALGGYVLALIVRAIRAGGHQRAVPMLVPTVVGVVFGLHDLDLLLRPRVGSGGLLSPYTPPLALVATFWLFVRRLGDSLEATHRLNVELERRVGEKHAELEQNYRRLGQLERERAVAGERDRIMRDMHDGMGGQLVSTLAMVESGRFTSGAVAEALRDALDDLRLVIDSLDPTEDDLVAVLGTLRSRLEPRLHRHGLRFDWQVTDLPRLPDLGPERVLRALRIVQEAITNVVKHARATTITVRTGRAALEGHPGVFVEVGDDGCGLGPAPPRGRGLANMERRAAALGARLTIGSDTAGTRVRLWLPLAEDVTRRA